MVQFFDPVHQGVAQAVVDSVAENVIPIELAESLVIVVSVFIHAKAEDDSKLFQNNYEATKLALKRAMTGKPSAAEIQQTRHNN